MATTENANLCGLKRENFQTTINGKKTDLYILRNRKGYEVAISNYGGAICAIMVPDKDGKVANVIQGHDSIQQLMSGNEPYLSTLIGRWGNRICKGQFTLNGKDYQLALNDGPNHLHGGAVGFNAKVWDARQMGPRALALHRISSYGEEGYTGELDITVEFTFTDLNELVIEYLATTNKKTIVNLTHHAFFSLTGTADPTPTIEDQICEINADFYLPTDNTAIPTGEILKVEGTPFDFRKPKTFGQEIDADNEQIIFGHGYDHNYCLSGNHAARLGSDKSGIEMTVETDRPGMQVYTANLTENLIGKVGRHLGHHCGICLETQLFPNALACPDFPSPILKKDQKFHTETVYTFTN